MRIVIHYSFFFDGLKEDGVAVNLYHDHDVLHSGLRCYTNFSRLVRMYCLLQFNDLYVDTTLFATAKVYFVDGCERDLLRFCGANIVALPHHVSRQRSIVLWLVLLNGPCVCKRKPHKITEPSRCG